MKKKFSSFFSGTFMKLFWKGPFWFLSKFGLLHVLYVTSFIVRSGDSFPAVFLLRFFLSVLV